MLNPDLYKVKRATSSNIEGGHKSVLHGWKYNERGTCTGDVTLSNSITFIVFSQNDDNCEKMMKINLIVTIGDVVRVKVISKEMFLNFLSYVICEMILLNIPNTRVLTHTKNC